MKILNKKIAAKKSSAAWIQRQAADPYVARAHRDGYRARAVYKLIEINEKYKFLKNGRNMFCARSQNRVCLQWICWK